VDLATVTSRVADTPFMTPEQGARIYEHLLSGRIERPLDVGTWHGASAAYAAAALHELGRGVVTTVDKAQRVPSPAPEDALFGRLPELRPHVEFVRPADSSYVWWLGQQVARRSDRTGNCEPLHDFCYLDGAHNFTIDGCAAVLIERLLRPGAWLVLDDLNWTYALSEAATHPFDLSEDELVAPHMRLVFDLVVRQHPSFTEFRLEDGGWGWARKTDGAGARRYEVTSTVSLAGFVIDALKRTTIRARSRRALRARDGGS
jgi:hypothetical protein